MISIIGLSPKADEQEFAFRNIIMLLTVLV